MSRLYVLLFAIVFCLYSRAQDMEEYRTVDSLALAIPDAQTHSTEAIASYINRHFTTTDDKLRAVYTWLAYNIRYDLSMLKLAEQEKDVDALVSHALKERRGVCFQFAGLFHEIAEKLGVKSYTVSGYTKKYGKVMDDSHQWVAAQVGDDWYFYDPTWASGYRDEKIQKQVQHFNGAYFRVLPQELIQSHMPFDPLWQFLDYPLTYPEFDVAETIRTDSVYFNWRDTLAVYERSDERTYLLDETRRMRANGTPNRLVEEKIALNDHNISVDRYNNEVALFNETVKLYNSSVEQLNRFIHYRNATFVPEKEESEVRGMLAVCDENIGKALYYLSVIRMNEGEIATAVADLKRQIITLHAEVGKHQVFLDTYYSTPLENRKSLFLKP